MTTTNLDRNGPGAGWGVDDDTDEGEEPMTKEDFTPGMRVRAFARHETPRRLLGVGVVAERDKDAPLDAMPTLVLVDMPEHDGFRAMAWWCDVEQLEPI